MAVKVRPEVSSKNKYHLERHRYFELKHFCMQYPIWKKAYASVEVLSHHPERLALFKTTERGTPTERAALARASYLERIEMLERTAKETDEILGSYILQGVVDGVSYEILNARQRVPCSKSTYYELYRKFFWLLDKKRN